MPRPKYSSLLLSENHEEEKTEEITKERLQRQTNRAIRKLSTMSIWGCDGILAWLVRTSVPWIGAYGLLCFAIYYGKEELDFSLRRDVFEVENLSYDLVIMDILQLLGAFLVGFAITEAGSRYKSAMGALLNLQESLEQLRSDLICNTNDPKFRMAIQAMIAWLVVLLRKKIVFFTEDFSQPIVDLVPVNFRACILFDPEMLWAFDKNQFEYVFLSFVREAHLLDSNGQTLRTYEKAMESWAGVAELLMVRAPNTSNVLTMLLIGLMLGVVPVFNDDKATLMLMPFIAGFFMTMMQFSTELSDPWGNDYHDLPLKDILYYLSFPIQFKGEEQSAKASLDWFNKGLASNDWTWTGDFSIPRTKQRGAAKGTQINFEDFRSLADMSGYASYEELKGVKGNDMNQAAARGRRMPGYLRWRDANGRETSDLLLTS